MCTMINKFAKFFSSYTFFKEGTNNFQITLITVQIIYKYLFPNGIDQNVNVGYVLAMLDFCK